MLNLSFYLENIGICFQLLPLISLRQLYYCLLIVRKNNQKYSPIIYLKNFISLRKKRCILSFWFFALNIIRLTYLNYFIKSWFIQLNKFSNTSKLFAIVDTGTTTLIDKCLNLNQYRKCFLDAEFPPNTKQKANKFKVIFLVSEVVL